VIKGYSGRNKIDITDSNFPISDKNNLKWTGVVKEAVPLPKMEKTADDEFDTASSNILLYKTLFRSFSL
jgi:hypothetical protein